MKKKKEKVCYAGYGDWFYNHFWHKYKKTKVCYRCGETRKIKVVSK